MNHEIDLTGLWENYRGLVYSECKRFYGSPDYDDLVQEGFLALCAAAESYDPDKGVFSTWAVYYIRQYVRRYFFRDSMAKIPFWALPCVSKYRNAQPLPSIEQLRQEFGYSEETARTALAAISIAGGVTSMQAEIAGKEGVTVGDIIADPGAADPEASAVEAVAGQELKEAMSRAVRTLSPEEQDVITRHYYDGSQLTEIAKETGRKLRHVYDVEARALGKLRRRHELAAFRDSAIRSNGMKHTGAGSFNRTWTSATEREALRLIERGARYT